MEIQHKNKYVLGWKINLCWEANRMSFKGRISDFQSESLDSIPSYDAFLFCRQKTPSTVVHASIDRLILINA